MSPSVLGFPIAYALHKKQPFRSDQIRGRNSDGRQVTASWALDSSCAPCHEQKKLFTLASRGSADQLQLFSRKITAFAQARNGSAPPSRHRKRSSFRIFENLQYVDIQEPIINNKKTRGGSYLAVGATQPIPVVRCIV